MKNNSSEKECNCHKCVTDRFQANIPLCFNAFSENREISERQKYNYKTKITKIYAKNI